MCCARSWPVFVLLPYCGNAYLWSKQQLIDGYLLVTVLCIEVFLVYCTGVFGVFLLIPCEHVGNKLLTFYHLLSVNCAGRQEALQISADTLICGCKKSTGVSHVIHDES